MKRWAIIALLILVALQMRPQPRGTRVPGAQTNQ